MNIDLNIVAFSAMAFIIGATIVWLIMRSRSKLIAENLTSRIEIINVEHTNLIDEVEQLEKQLHALNKENKSLNTFFEVCKQKYKGARDRIVDLQTDYNHLKDRQNQCVSENARLRETIAEIKTLNQQQKQSADEKLTLLNESRVEMLNQFKTLANDIFEEKDKKFSQSSKERLDGILNPFNKHLRDFKQTVNDVYINEAKQRASLKTEIQGLKQLNEKLNSEAINLTRALKGDKKLQGNWGELILERVLEQSGLRKNHEYETQGGFRDAENNILKPDVIIHLPHDKDIIVDSKVSLKAYECYSSAKKENEKAEFLKRHVQAIANHIKSLSEKDYTNLTGINSLDFVLMFIPIEPAFMLAFEHNDKLFSDAFSSKIIVVTPTTLLAALKTIENLWRYEKQNQNARVIAQRAGNLYDKFRGFIEDMEKLGKQIDTTQNTYHDAINKLKTGKGNLISQSKQLLDLGVKVKKEIPKSMIENSETDL